MSVMEIFWLDLVIVFGVTILSFILFAGERLVAAWFAFCITAAVSFWGWVIYVAVHFIGKYW
jgi:hypothetical protein